MPKGKKAVFTRAQNRVLRNELRLLRQRYESQAALGDAVGIEQQNVGRLLSEDGSGFSYKTATAVARLAGHVGVDAFFRAKGVALPSEPPHAKAG